jgi:hypothetical protein
MKGSFGDGLSLHTFITFCFIKFQIQKGVWMMCLCPSFNVDVDAPASKSNNVYLRIYCIYCYYVRCLLIFILSPLTTWIESA